MTRRSWYLFWTEGHLKRVKTKKRGEELMRVWKKWQERQGLTVQRRGDAYVARSPSWSEDPRLLAGKAIALREEGDIPTRSG